MSAKTALPYLLAAVAAGASALALLPEPSHGAPPPTTDFVIVIGVSGLRWDDVDRSRTPNLWRLAERGAVGALSTRSAREIVCPADGWLTLGAGDRAIRATSPDELECPAAPVQIEQPYEPAATVTDQRSVVRYNRSLPWDPRPGALAEAVRCTTAIGQGGAIAGARPFGRVDRYLSSPGPSLSRQLVACSLAIVDLGEVEGDGAGRQDGARAVDKALGAVLAARPERSLVMVAGLPETGESGRLHVAIADGPGYARGWLTSTSTGRQGYLQLVDLAPTVLAALSRPAPEELFAGAPAELSADRPEPLRRSVAKLADADRQVSVQRRVADDFFTVLAVGQVTLLVAVIPVLRRVRRPAGPGGRPPLPRWIRWTAEVGLVAAALAVPAALVADAVPWWRFSLPGWVFAAITLAVLVAATAVVVVSTRRRRTLGPVGLIAGIAAVAVVFDVVTGARLQLNGVAGYSAASAGRDAGLGTVGLGVLIGGTLLLGGALSQRVARAWRPCVVAAVGAAGVVVVGSPYLGADAAGAVALATGVCLAVAAASGGWLTLGRVVAAVVTAAVVTTGLALLDLTRPPARRGNIGRFLVDLGEGTGGLASERLGESNVVAMATSPLTVLVVGSVGFGCLLVLRQWGGLRRLFGLYPAIRAALIGIGVATVFAGLIEGVGLNVLGTAAAIAGPLVGLGALRVLDHANDRSSIARTAEAPRRDGLALADI